MSNAWKLCLKLFNNITQACIRGFGPFVVMAFCLLSLPSQSQNLVQNPSIEEYTGDCDWERFDKEPIGRFPGWIPAKYTEYNIVNYCSIQTSNFFRTKCNPCHGVDAPLFGDACIFSLDYSFNNFKYIYYSNLRDSVLQKIGGANDLKVNQLLKPMKKGQTYFFSVYLIPSLYNKYYTSIYNETVYHTAILTSDFAVGGMTSTQEITWRETHLGYLRSDQFEDFPPLASNPPNNLVENKPDSSWTELRFTFTADKDYPFLFFGHYTRPGYDNYQLLKGVEYTDSAALWRPSGRGSSFSVIYYYDGFTLLPYPELGDTLYMCGKDSLLLNPQTPKNRLKWFNGATDTTQWVYEPGLYTVTAFSDFTQVTDSVWVLPGKPKRWNADTTFCQDEAPILRLPSSANDIQWHDGSTEKQLRATEPGPVWATFTLGSACRDSLYTRVAFDSLQLKLPNDTTLCEEDVLELDIAHQDARQYNWSHGLNTPQISIKQAGQYVASIANQHCSLTDTFSLQFEKRFAPPISDTTICEGDSLQLSFSEDFAVLNGEQENPLTFRDVGSYTLTWEQAFCGPGSVDFQLEHQPCECHAWVPNAFTPNGDGLNDGFKPVLNCAVTHYRFTIYNRWGQRIFSSNDPNEAFETQNLPVGQYLWTLSYRAQLPNREQVVFTDGKMLVVK